jgi:hypothetical protein
VDGSNVGVLNEPQGKTSAEVGQDLQDSVEEGCAPVSRDLARNPGEYNQIIVGFLRLRDHHGGKVDRKGGNPGIDLGTAPQTAGKWDRGTNQKAARK